MKKNEAAKKAVSRITNKINDSLRYTFILPEETYSFDFSKTLNLLKSLGYKIPKNEIWNAWKNAGTKFDRGYRGINITVVSSQKQKFELQFHTKESFRLKMKTHGFYKKLTALEDSAKKREIIGSMIESAEKITVPQGVESL